jgi:hypothetical protein
MKGAVVAPQYPCFCLALDGQALARMGRPKTQTQAVFKQFVPLFRPGSVGGHVHVPEYDGGSFAGDAITSGSFFLTPNLQIDPHFPSVSQVSQR